MASLRKGSSFNKLKDILTKKNIDIACIQETHNESTDTIEIGEYDIIFGGSSTDEK